MVLSERSFLRVAALLVLGLGVAAPAAARITCCDVDGKRVCGDPPPQQCINKARTVFDKGGVAKAVEAPLTAEQRTARDAEVARKKEEERIAAEQTRKDSALRDSYSNEKEIDHARDRAIVEIEKNAEQAKNRLEAALNKQKTLDQEKEFYKKKPMPAALQAQVRDNASEIAAQQKALEQKDTDIAAVKERYATDKKRYIQITSGSAKK
jgi:hypothetical protein